MPAPAAALHVSISQSRFLSFQVQREPLQDARLMPVSISQSRFLSFQARIVVTMALALISFNLAIEILVISGLAFQCLLHGRYWRFNLAIEMLVISGIPPARCSLAQCTFQSRNRDSCHFRFRQDLARCAQGAVVSISQSRFLSFQVRCPQKWR